MIIAAQRAAMARPRQEPLTREFVDSSRHSARQSSSASSSACQPPHPRADRRPRSCCATSRCRTARRAPHMFHVQYAFQTVPSRSAMLHVFSDLKRPRLQAPRPVRQIDDGRCRMALPGEYQPPAPGHAAHGAQHVASLPANGIMCSKASSSFRSRMSFILTAGTRQIGSNGEGIPFPIHAVEFPPLGRGHHARPRLRQREVA